VTAKTEPKDRTPIITAGITALTTLATTFMTVVLPKMMEVGHRGEDHVSPRVQHVAQQVQQVVVEQRPTEGFWASMAPSSSNFTGEILVSVGLVLVITLVSLVVHYAHKANKLTKKR